MDAKTAASGVQLPPTQQSKKNQIQQPTNTLPPNMPLPTQQIPPKSSVIKTDKPRPHVCVTCTRSFARLEHLKRHERSHTKEKPFQCPVCERCFARRDLLLRHKQKLHASFPETPRVRATAKRKSVSAAVTKSAKVTKTTSANPSPTSELVQQSPLPPATEVSPHDMPGPVANDLVSCYFFYFEAHCEPTNTFSPIEIPWTTTSMKVRNRHD